MKSINALIERVFFSSDFDELRMADFNEMMIKDNNESRLIGALGVYLFSQNNENKENAHRLLESFNNDVVRNCLFLKTESEKELEQDGTINELLCDVVLKEQESRVYDLQDRLVSLRSVFFPSGALYAEDYSDTIDSIRKKRTLIDCVPSDDPVTDGAREILFTSNGLLTVPSSNKSIEDITDDIEMQKILKEALSEEQKFWYDHPIPIGTEEKANEILYGLKNLNEALFFEKERGTMHRDQSADVVLSMSVTHPSLQKAAGIYLRKELSKMDDLSHINVFGFTEADTEELINRVLIPAAKKYFPDSDVSGLKDVFGVDGEYGRHYSFLKAVAPLWKAVMNEDTKATFKIDLDQVFPQNDLLRETGKSALELLCFPLWGGHGEDSWGNDVEMGMIAGALVNGNDISKGLFTPDVPLAPIEQKADGIIFPSVIPQALSTEAEMMTIYEDDSINGVDSAIQRIHVTGGTNGIRIDSLLKYRPFTPSFIGRAEDQCYILSVLQKSIDDCTLRYIHRDGLIMRHDKENFALEAIEAAKTGKVVGDYIRMILFSRYSQALPYDFSALRNEVLPFTGSFITEFPITISLMRMMLKAAYLCETEEGDEAMKLLELGSERIKETLKDKTKSVDGIQQIFEKEERAWNLYYDIVQVIIDLSENEDVVEWKTIAKEIIEQCRVS
jgi:hypothetical protein